MKNIIVNLGMIIIQRVILLLIELQRSIAQLCRGAALNLNNNVITINRLAYQIHIINKAILYNNKLVVKALKRKYFKMADYADSLLLLILIYKYKVILKSSQLIINIM